VRAQDDKVTFNVFDCLKHSNTEKYFLKTNAANEVIHETKDQLDLSNILEKVIHHCISQVVEKKKELVPKFVEKQLTNKESYTSDIKEEDKVQPNAIIVHDEFKLGQPIMFRNAKLKFQPRWLKTKGSRLWIAKEIKTDGTLKL